jgi:hypothetical protein
MKTILTILISILLTSCISETPQEMEDRFLTELKCPVVLIGKTDKAVQCPAITVRDKEGRVRTLSKCGRHKYSYVAVTISESRSIGDTLKPCN